MLRWYGAPTYNTGYGANVFFIFGFVTWNDEEEEEEEEVKETFDAESARESSSTSLLFCWLVTKALSCCPFDSSLLVGTVLFVTGVVVRLFLDDLLDDF